MNKKFCQVLLISILMFALFLSDKPLSSEVDYPTVIENSTASEVDYPNSNVYSKN